MLKLAVRGVYDDYYYLSNDGHGLFLCKKVQTWCDESNISVILEYNGYFVVYFHFECEESLMAFKLRWS